MRLVARGEGVVAAGDADVVESERVVAARVARGRGAQTDNNAAGDRPSGQEKEGLCSLAQPAVSQKEKAGAKAVSHLICGGNTKYCMIRSSLNFML